MITFEINGKLYHIKDVIKYLTQHDYAEVVVKRGMFESVIIKERYYESHQNFGAVLPYYIEKTRYRVKLPFSAWVRFDHTEALRLAINGKDKYTEKRSA